MKIVGMHHVSMKCMDEDYSKALDFYQNKLNLPIYKQWDNGVLFSTGNGYIEIFNHGTHVENGIIGHFALAVDDVDSAILEIKNLGYEILLEPKDVLLQDLPARVAFFVGPIGEHVELFEVK